MADQKISELTALTGANVADDDAIAIVDASATETKKIVFSELKNALDTATGFVRITGDTMTGALNVQSTITSDGLTVDNATVGDLITVTGANGTDLRIGNHASANGGIYINSQAASDDLRFRTQGSDRMTIDSSGNVGIGNSTPSNNHANANNLVVGNGTAGGIANYVGTGLGWYAFSRANANNSDAFDGGISYDGSRNLMFHTNAGNERMRLDSSGRLLHGKTTSGDYVTGTEIQPAGAILSYRAGGVAAIHGRTDDGEIIRLTSNSSIVGSIGTSGGDVYIGTGTNASVRFNDGVGALTPASGTANADNAVNLGYSTLRWKDLYLSGGVYLGGTGSANKLEDYEEGTWTPTWLGTASNPTVSYANQEGTYVKIGSFVYVKLRLNITSSSGGSGTLLLNGLPFTATNDSGALGVASLGYKTGFVTQGPDYGRCLNSYIEMYYDNGTAEAAIGPANLGSGTQCIFAAVYTTTQ